MAGRRKSRAARELLRQHRQQTVELVSDLERVFSGRATVSVLSWGNPLRDPLYGGTPAPVPRRGSRR